MVATATMMSTEPHRRTRSFSDSDRRGRPQPPKFVFDSSRPNGTRRTAMPRSTSTSDINRLAAAMASKGDGFQDPDDAFRDVAREQIDMETLRDLAQFFRTTAPPSHPGGNVENCFGKEAPQPVNRRWSIRSLRKAPKTRRSTSQLSRLSQQSHDSTILKTTSAGHAYRAISVPPSSTAIDGREQQPTLQPRLSGLRSSAATPLADSRYSVVQSRASRASMASSQLQTRSERSSKAGDLAAVVSRSSSKIDKNPYRLSVRVSTAEPGVRSFLKLVDEWLEDQGSDTESRPPSRPTSQGRPRTSGPPLAPVITHRTATSVATLSPVMSEPGDDGGDSSAPKIELNPPGLSPSTSLKGTPEFESGFPATPPPVGIQEPGFSHVAGGRQTDLGEAASMGTPRSSESQPPKSLSPPPRSDSLRYLTKGADSPRSIRQSLQKRPSNITVSQGLQVPHTSKLPESPGFPAMLATMSFPSPPESVRSHSPSNSISTSPPQTAGWPSKSSPPPSNLNQRVMETLQNDAANAETASPHSFVTANPGSPDPESVDPLSAVPPRASRSHHHVGEETPAPAVMPLKDSAAVASNSRGPSRVSQDSVGPFDSQSHRDSVSSTIDSSRQSVAMSDRHRQSIRSDTSATSDMTATTEVNGNTKSRRAAHRESVDSTALGRQSESKRSSIISASSAGTSGTATSLAERRMARRARVREKLQRDLEASRSNLRVQRPGPAGETVDSPVLGWFPQIGPVPRKGSAQGPSPLAMSRQSPEPDDTPSQETKEKPSSQAARRSSVQDMISPLIPETVQETTSPTTPTTPRPSSKFTLSPIMMEETEPDHSQSPLSPALTMSPIMVVANIEARSPAPTTLRPLSLLTNAPAPNVPPRSTLRPDVKANKRPLPIRISKNTLDLTVNTTGPSNSTSKRYSSPAITTPPISAVEPGSPRRSLPLSRDSNPSSAPASYTPNNHSPEQPHRRRQVQSMMDKETLWLTEHQRQSAEEWRTAALRERSRREGWPQDTKAVEDEDETAAKHRHSTLMTLDTNTRADDTVERRLLNAIVPLLESMNSTLKEMQNNTVNRELSAKFMDSALALSPLLENGMAVDNEVDGQQR